MPQFYDCAATTKGIYTPQWQRPSRVFGHSDSQGIEKVWRIWIGFMKVLDDTREYIGSTSSHSEPIESLPSGSPMRMEEKRLTLFQYRTRKRTLYIKTLGGSRLDSVQQPLGRAETRTEVKDRFDGCYYCALLYWYWRNRMAQDWNNLTFWNWWHRPITMYQDRTMQIYTWSVYCTVQ